MPYSQVNILSKGKYISNIKRFYSDKLEEINYTQITPKFHIKFNEEEKYFVKNVNERLLIKIDPKVKILLEKYLIPDVNFNYLFQREVFSCVFKNIQFVGGTGILIHNGRALIESCCDILRFSRNKVFFQIIPKKKKLKGFYTSIMFWDYDCNHSHFLIDSLPRLYAITKIEEPKINLIVPKDINKTYLDIIKLFLDKRFKIIYIDYDEIWELENFYFASFCSNNSRCRSYIPKLYLDFLKEKILKSLEIKKGNKNKRIYISRSKAKERRVLNEGKLLELIKKHNFEIIHTEDLAFKEQVKLFNSASIVISPHGAGLANIIFSEKIKVIELFPPKYLMPHYFMISKVLGFKYRFSIGTESDDNYNFNANLDEIEKYIIELSDNE
ncbi:MAG: DUF563 domain-containing protein [Promethearchaeota archaeon]